MRLGETKSVIDEVSSADKQIIISAEPLYDGQAYRIGHYFELIKALDILNGQSWNEVDYSGIEELKASHSPQLSTAVMSSSEYSKLGSYVSAINNKLPVFMGILETFAKPQPEQLINIKLPQDLTSFTGLNKLNEGLDKLFKEFKVDGEVEFQGFDRGSAWYMVLLSGPATYAIFLSSLKAAQEYFKMRAEYFKSKQAELDYRASLNANEEYNDSEQKRYQEKRLDLELDDKVNKALEQVEARNGHTEAELHAKVLKATKELIKQLDGGVEFHLSLEPPTYAKEKSGRLIIDYAKMKEIREQSSEQGAQIGDGSKKSE